MRSKNAVDQNFEHFDVDDQEANVHKKVQNGRPRAVEHLFLPEGDEQSIAPAFAGIIGNILVVAQVYVLGYLADLPDKKADGNNSNEQENDMTNHGLFGCGSTIGSGKVAKLKKKRPENNF